MGLPAERLGHLGDRGPLGPVQHGDELRLLRAFPFFQAEDGIRVLYVTGVQTCALPICGFPANIAASGASDWARSVRAAGLQEERRNASRTELILRRDRFVGSDEDGGFPANIAASGASDWARGVGAAGLQEERRNASRTELILRRDRFVGSDEDGGFPANIAAS